MDRRRQLRAHLQQSGLAAGPRGDPRGGGRGHGVPEPRRSAPGPGSEQPDQDPQRTAGHVLRPRRHHPGRGRLPVAVPAHPGRPDQQPAVGAGARRAASVLARGSDARAGVGDRRDRLAEPGLLDGDLPRRAPVDPGGAHRGSRGRRCGSLAAVRLGGVAAARPGHHDQPDPDGDRGPQGVQRGVHPHRRGTGTATQTLSALIYKAAFEFNQFGYSIALALVLAVIVAAVSALQFRLSARSGRI